MKTKHSVISADSHVVEPKNLWLDYIEPKYRDRAPKIVREGETDYFYADALKIVPPFGFSVAGRGAEKAPRTFEEGVYLGAYDPDARLKDMALDGVDADVVYPSVGLRMFPIPDLGYKWACLRAYNRWAGDFAKVHPDRIKALAMIAHEDIERAVSELRDAHSWGLCGAMVTVASEDPGLYAGQTLDPLWAAAEQLRMPISLHVISNQVQGMDLRGEVESALYHMHIQRSLTNMVFSGVFYRFPGLKVVSAENDAGWAPYFFDRLDYIYSNPRRQTYQNYAIKGKGMLPSEYIKRGVSFTFMRDASAVYVRELIGTSNLMWASDYPHNDSTWPKSREMLDRLFGKVPAAHRRQMVAENAARLYGFS